jgi:hypothetical protein
MSRRSDRLARQAEWTRDQDELIRARQEPPARAFDSNPRSWQSFCAGWRGRFHEKANVEADGSWRCRWCWRTFDPPEVTP